MVKQIKPIRPLALPRAPRPMLSLCVMFRDNLDTIRPLLASVKDHFDEYVFCDTGSSDGTRAVVEGFFTEDCKPNSTKLIDFAWCDDFAKARQANFEAATGVWRMFLDSDDVLKDGANVRQIVAKVASTRPEIQGLYVHYDYDVLEDLPTFRLVRWNRNWHWVDAIHERLVSKEDHGAEALGFLPREDLSVWHKRKSEGEKAAALVRNAVIARREYTATDDVEYRARLARTIAMELKLNGDFEGATPYLREVLDVYGHMPEGRQAAADLQRFAAMSGDLETALHFARLAGPSYETMILSAQGRHAEALARGAVASVAGQQTTHEGFLFEQVLTPVAMADSAAALGYHPSRIERVLNTVRTDLRNHPAAAPHVTKHRLDIDRITILVPNTPQPFDGQGQAGMLGGSEEAVVHLSQSLAKLGRNVRVFGVLPPTTLPGVDDRGIDWQPFSAFRVNDEHGTLVVWRAAGMLYELGRLKQQIETRAKAGDDTARWTTGILNASLWLHDQTVNLSADKNLTAKVLADAAPSVVVLSDHHRRMIERELPADHKVNFVALSNGIDGDVFYDALKRAPGRDPYRVVYSSCPSRGLMHLLRMWPEVKAAVPEAKLDIYYDWGMIRAAQPEFYKELMAAMSKVKDLDVVHHGGVSHSALHTALMQCNVWAYSHYDNTNVETFCISAVKATAAGATVLTAPFGALPEVAPEAHFVADPKDYAAALIEHLRKPVDPDTRYRKAMRAIERFGWDTVAEKFSALWTVR